jgi:hypothetical protein
LAFVAGLRAAAAVVFAAERFALAGLRCALPLVTTGLRRAAGAPLRAARVLAPGRAVRLAAGFATAFGFGRDVASLRLSVACLAGAAAFFTLATGRRALPTTLPEGARLPDPLAGVDAFIPGVSPSSTRRA